MGTVWLARRSDGRFEGRAAVKFLNVGLLGSSGEERFKREGSILARLAHPNIAHLIDAGVSPNGQPYLILEYVEGKNIDVYCDQHALDIEARIRLFLDVLAAVAHAHANLIVHRDIKPSNVLVTADGQVKLLDFGIAKLLEDEAGTPGATVLTRQGERALTLAYAAPEQVIGNAVTTGTDIYALGTLLYLLLTGKHPAESALQSPANLVKAIVDTDPALPSEITEASDNSKRALRGDLDTIVAKTLKKSSAERYGSVTALADDLRRYLGHQTISARPDTLAYRARKFVRRNRLGVALASAAIVATGAGLVGTIIQARRAASAAERARIDARNATDIKDFLLGIFQTAAKTQRQSETTRELLDRGTERLLADRTLEPQVALDLLLTLADLYYAFGYQEKTADLTGKGVELARAAFARNDPRLALALVTHAGRLRYTSRAKEAFSSLEEAERILDANGDQSSPLWVRANIIFAEYWRTTGADLRRARSYATKGIAICRRHHPDQLPEALQIAARTEAAAHHTAASAALLGEATELYRRRPEGGYPWAMAELAEQEGSLSHFAAAERAFKESLALCVERQGEDGSCPTWSRMKYGVFLRASQRLGESEELLRKVAETMVRLYGPDESYLVPWARSELASTLAEIGKIEEADSLYRRAIAAQEKTLPNTYRHGDMLESAALLQLLLGQYEIAEQMLTRAEAISEHIGRDDSAYVALRRAQYQLAVGEANQALSTLAPTTFSEGGALPGSFTADVIRARALLELGQPNQAERVASVSLDRLSATPGAEFLELSKAELLVSRGLALTRLGRPKEALTPLRDSLARREARLDAKSPLLAESLIALAECHLSQGERAQARSLIERAQHIHRSHAKLGEHLRLPLRKVEQRLAAR